jgi:DNA helicase HerA-like ATPase
MSGAGKTHTASVIIEELANKTDYSMVILDPNGEYTTIDLGGQRFKNWVESGALSSQPYPFNSKVSIYACNHREVTETLEKSGASVGRTARFSVKPVSTRWPAASEEKAETELKSNFREAVKPNQIAILNSKGLSFEERRSFHTCSLNALWNCRVDGSIAPFILVIEDAENIETNILEKIASEGRKLGVSMCLLSQNLTELSSRVLSQMGIQLVGRTVYSEQLGRLGSIAMENSVLLPQLRTGEWIINGITLRNPTKVYVRDRYSISKSLLSTELARANNDD